MARSLTASGTNELGPNLSFIVDQVTDSGQIRIILKEGADTVDLRFENKEQAREWIRDLDLAINALGGARR